MRRKKNTLAFRVSARFSSKTCPIRIIFCRLRPQAPHFAPLPPLVGPRTPFHDSRRSTKNQLRRGLKIEAKISLLNS